MKKSNVGFSLIELLVVLAILGILSGGVALSASMIFRADNTKVMKTLKTAVENIKSLNENKGDAYSLKIYLKDGIYYTCVYKDKTQATTPEVLLSAEKGTIYWDGSPLEAETDQEGTISFNRVSGALKQGPDVIQIQFADGTEKSLHFVKATGKIYEE